MTSSHNHCYVGKYQLRFGKYKFRTLEDVWSEDPYYCLSFLRYLPNIPKFGYYINEQYCNDLEYFENNFNIEIRRTSVTSMLKSLSRYHKTRIYDCFEGQHILHKYYVHESSSYPSYIKENCLFSYNGVFYDLLIRKYISNFLKNQDAFDFKVDAYLSSLSQDCNYYLLDSYEQDYEMFKDEDYSVMEILPNIFNLALLEKAVKEGTVDNVYEEKMIDRENIEDVLSYIGNIPNIEEAILNPILDINFFSADADFIVNDIIYDIKVSEKKKDLTIDDFLQLIFYALAYYMKTGTEIREYIIYNPLLGKEHILKLNGLNFEKLIKFFEDVIVQ